MTTRPCSKPALSTALVLAAASALAAVSMLVAPADVNAQDVDAQDVDAQDVDAEIGAAVDAYHAALASGDSATALGLLSDDVVILESGGMEDKTHYRSGHLAGDMRFARAVPRERGEMQVTRVGEVAWVWSTSRRTGRMGEREIDSRGAELMVLRRVDGRWVIEAIHWSSRSRS
jgi:ketosteroid isomerase-like protein